METVKKSDEMLLEEAQKIFPFEVTLLSEIVGILDKQTKQFANDSIDGGCNPQTILLDLKETTDSFEENKKKLKSFLLSVPESHLLILQLKTNDIEINQLVELNILGILTSEEANYDEYSKVYGNQAFRDMVTAVIGIANDLLREETEKIKPVIEEIISEHSYIFEEITNIPSHTLDYELMELQVMKQVRSLYEGNFLETANVELSESEIKSIVRHLRTFTLMYKDEVLRDRSIEIAMEFYELKSSNKNDSICDEALYYMAEENVYSKLKKSLASEEKDELIKNIKSITR